MDYISEIAKLKKEKNAIILAHYYQIPEIQDIADYIGDSLGLAQKAASTDAELIVFAGVHFMAETAKILNPNKMVLLPDLEAGCSLADSCPPVDFKKFRDQYPDHIVLSYINCSSGIKELSDVIVTSGNAVQIVESFPKDQKIIFAPDKNLGGYINNKTGREMVLWDGTCEVHDILSTEAIIKLKMEHPDAELVAHPECDGPVLALADMIGSTTAMLKYTKKSNAKKFIVASETGILHQMQKDAPEKEFMVVPKDETCNCNDCPYMKLNTLEKLYLCLKNETPQIELPEDVMKRAEKPINKMLDISREMGLI
ncbi:MULTISPECIES: quinolinate synthase NadA [unclassified Lentimicrobium]|uniref:quinolinate synthase NadA n=1 Tax=unclassified Lentimicrobium TaxID=2677434 RepID=UPI001553BA89|nr:MULTISPECIES: quinolinate synthase NadA [unclassified Lentimicrobium]NPD47029.1 quinolinate synthase NadA [Lentimicrobium sp. S6]NPD84850.1 quinolinate synthase NadA [Lentimicrobium sp. L6]